MKAIRDRAALIRVLSPAAADFAARVARGELDAAAVVEGLRGGGAAYAKAIRDGDLASPEEIAEKLACCAVCPSRVRDDAGGKAEPNDYCGQPFVGSADPPTCGCPCLVVATIGSKRCPQGRTLADSVPPGPNAPCSPGSCCA